MISLGILKNSNYNNNNNNNNDNDKIIDVHNNPQVDSIASKEDMESKNELKPSLLTHVPLTSFTESLYTSMKSNDNGNSLMPKVTPAKLSRRVMYMP